MSVRRKLFFTIASFIVGMGIVYGLMTQFVIAGILKGVLDDDRSPQINALSQMFLDYYVQHGESWSGVEQLDVKLPGVEQMEDVGYALLAKDTEGTLIKTGYVDVEQMLGLGIRKKLRWEGNTIAILVYYDAEVAKSAKLHYGIRGSGIFVLLVGMILFVILSLWVAFLLSKRLTAPLRALITGIDRLGQGELGVQVPVVTKDEYATVANAFNLMSTQLAQAEKVRKNLTADVAHELRTPLTIIRGKLDQLQQEGRLIEPERLLSLQDECIRLTKLVDDLHQLSLAEAKKLHLEKKWTSIPDLLERCIERVKLDAEHKFIRVTLLSAPNVPLVEVDPNRMMQVFLNLLVNAVRYTPVGGKVQVRVETGAGETDTGKLLIQVSDTGEGIDADQLPLLFNRFYRTDEARTRNKGGMGLGLAISQELVRLHEGSIEASSVRGKGTTFTVKLPIS
ncbi:ATP-binding protein [Brevibacillus panacihumi]|uniref:sensor histidine kinase n=1 Tax=Brevibacillus panacihumi TaxID=497735 RepID=UPI003D23A753